LGQMSEARARFQRALELAPQRADTWTSLALVVRWQGELELAAELLERAVQCRPDDGVAHLELGRTWHACNLLDRAIASYKIAQQLAPDNPKPLKLLAQAYEAQGEMRLACDAIDQALALSADDGLRIRRALLLPVIIESRQSLLESRRCLVAELDKLEAM